MKFYLSPIVWENGNAFSFATEFPVTKYQERYQFVNERSMEHFQMNYLMDRGSSPNPQRLVHAHFWNNGVALSRTRTFHFTPGESRATLNCY